ncbi:hypothetical protein ACJQWK_11624 [Exserohilum turcicum]
MDDLFEGYMVLDAVADFLAHSPLADRTKQPAIAPRPEHHVHDSNHASPSPSPVSAPTLRSPDPSVSSGYTAASAALRQRRGHTKSRLGCIGCKRRKVKCQETWPSCANCDKRGWVCRYSDAFKNVLREPAALDVPSPRQLVQLSDTPIMYSRDDMQLFHHYLVAAYPCVPHDFVDIWTRDVPVKSHQYSYLMEAMLALAGSHLALQVEKPKNDLALHHRQKAIVGLGEAFTRWPPTAEESHVMFAASFLLSYQSTFMEDGFLEHFVSLRGCSLLAQLIMAEGFTGPFVDQTNWNLIAVDSPFSKFPQLDQGLVHQALLSLKGFSPLVSQLGAHAIEKAVVCQLAQALRFLLHSNVDPKSEKLSEPDLPPANSLSPKYFAFTNPLLPADTATLFPDIDWDNITAPPPGAPFHFAAFKAMMATLTLFSTWPHEELVRIFDPANHLGNVVLAHFCAVRFILLPFTAPDNVLRNPAKAAVQWAAKIMAALDDDKSGQWAKYTEWPTKVIRCLYGCVEKNRAFTIGNVRDMLIQNPDLFRVEQAGT